MFEYPKKKGYVMATTDCTLKGVVIAQWGDRNEKVIMRCWNSEKGDYEHHRRYISGLMTLGNYYGDKMLNTEDVLYVERVNEALREAALICGDREMFDSTFEKKEKA